MIRQNNPLPIVLFDHFRILLNFITFQAPVHINDLEEKMPISLRISPSSWSVGIRNIVVAMFDPKNAR